MLDVGCGQVGLRALEPQLDITGVDVAERPGYPGPFVRADAAAGLPFASGEFDLVYCSSVIEHVHPARRAAFAAEIRRVARGWYVQTPAFSFPLEPHSLLPGAHWLPPPRVGAGLAPAPLRARAAVRPGAPRALRPAHQELGVRASFARSGRLA